MRDYKQQAKLVTDTGTHASDGAGNGYAGGGMLGVLVEMRIPEAEARQRESGYHNLRRT